MRVKRHSSFFAAVITLLLTAGCATDKNTSRTRWWKAFNTRYNVYYNGAQAYIDASLEKEQGNRDDFTKMLPIYTVANKTSRDIGRANYARAIEKAQKAIRLYSIKRRPEWTKTRRKTARDVEWLNRREYNPFLWKAWMLLGRAQFMSGDFDEAASTFAYMSRLYATQPAIYGRARAWLAKCYAEGGWLYDAEDVITKIRRDSLHWRAVKEWDNTYADYFLRSGRLDEAAPYLRKAISHEMRRKQRARLWYILGQVEAELGNKDKAYGAFKRVVRLNPPYELAFNARISMTEVLAGQQSEKMIKRLQRMALSENNRDYLDQIYYAIGNIYLSRKDTLKAISAYESGSSKALRSGIEKGVLLLKLGNLYWTRNDYSNARRCYGEAIGLLDNDRADYKQLSERAKVLDELVPFIETVHLQDSLQTLAKMPEQDRNAAIDRIISELRNKEKVERDAQAMANDVQQDGGQGTTVAGMNNQTAQTITQKQGSSWYFYNPVAVSQGKITFQKLWGKRENVDDWQRINKTVVAFGDANEGLSEYKQDSMHVVVEAQNSVDDAKDNLDNDPHKREYYLVQIPFTPQQKAESDKIIEESLFNAGVIFKDKLNNLKQSESFLCRLVNNYSDCERTDDALYHLFLLYSRRGDTVQATAVLDRLKHDFPDSKYTSVLTDPYFYENARFGVHIEDSLYAATYNAFKADNYSEVIVNTAISAKRFPMGANRDKFIFINALAHLNSGDTKGCLDGMESVVVQYPQSEVSKMAGMIINGVKAGRQLYGGRFDMSGVWRQRTEAIDGKDSIKQRAFKAERNTPFTFLIVYAPDSINANKLLFELARHNFTNFLVRDFDIVTDELNGLNRMKVGGFRNYDEALQYARQLYSNAALRQLITHGRTIIISNENLEMLGTQLSYADYEAFYERHFVPLRVSTVRLLTEPETIEYLPQNEMPVDSNESTVTEGEELYNGGVIEAPVNGDDDGITVVPEVNESVETQKAKSAEGVKKQGKQTVQPVKKTAERTKTLRRELWEKTQQQREDTGIDFNDDFQTVPKAKDTKKKALKEETKIEVEDEYYDLGGF